MNGADDSFATARAWLEHLLSPTGDCLQAVAGAAEAPALAVLAAEALARNRRLLIVTADDAGLADLSNALDLRLRPLCLVLPAADYALRIALQATLSLLKSRLARAGDDSEGPAWAWQRQQLSARADLWQECLAWSRRDVDGDPWPQELASLFPVCAMPKALAGQLAVTAEWVVLAGSRARADSGGPWPAALRTLILGATPSAPGGLAEPDAAARLKAELEVLTQELAELELELATAQAEVAEFSERYHRLVGAQLAIFDGLQAELAARQAAAAPDDLDAGRTAKAAQSRAEQSRRESKRFTDAAQTGSEGFAPTGNMKKLYRRIAQKIHPDRARSESDRAWRTQLMAEANRAYRANDEKALREVLTLWQEGSGRESALERDRNSLADQVGRLRRRIGEIEHELNRLFGSKLYELFTAATIARRTGRDLLQEMADRVEADIAAARETLARLN